MKDLGNGKFQIRNKKTGEVRVIGGNELPQYGLKSPVSASVPKVNFAASRSQPSQPGGLGSLLGQAGQGIAKTVAPVARDIGNVFRAPIQDIGSAIAPNVIPKRTAEQKASAERGAQFGMGLTAPGLGIAGPVPEVGPIVSSTLLSKLGKYRGIAKGTEKAGEKAFKPNLMDVLFRQSKIGKNIESKVGQAGEVTPEVIEQYFGKARGKGVQLLEGSTLLNIGSAKDRVVAEKLLNKELRALQKLEPITYDKLHVLEKEAGKLARFEKGTAPTLEQSFYRNIQQQYSNILKNNIEGLNKLFEAYTKSKKISKGVEATKKRAGWIAAGALGYSLIRKLFQGGKAITGSFEE